MEFLKAQLQRAQQQWAQLAPSQRMLAASLIVIMVMTMTWWGSLAGKSEMEVLLDQPMTAEELGAIRNRLATIGIPARVVGDRIHIAADRRLDALADLTVSHLLPADTRNAFDDLTARTNPFWSGRQQDQAFLTAKQTVLAQVIRRFPPVTHATVLIQPAQQRGMNAPAASASVSMILRPGEKPDARWAEAAADLVSGAVAGLDRGGVKVLINGVSQRIRSRGESETLPGDAGEIRMALQQKAEQYFVNKLQEQFRFIDGAMFSVSVKLDLGHKRTREHRVDPRSAVQKAVRERTSSEESRAGRGGGEPGMALNQPLSVSSTTAGSAPEGENGASESAETDFLVDMNKSDIESFNPGGESTATHASVLFPRSHFVRVYQQESGTKEKEPDATVLNDFVKSKLLEFKKHVRNATGMADDTSIALDVYTDLIPADALSAAPATAGLAMSLVTSHGKEIALGLLALVSLFMVSNIVKKSGPVPALATGRAATAASLVAPLLTPKAPLALVAGEEVVGEVRAGDALLEGMEVDTEAVRSQEMLKQVEELVGEDPDAAASLVKRWLSK